MIHKRNACADLDGVLEFVQAPVSMDEIGGLGKLKKWLADRHMASAVNAEEFGLANPRVGGFRVFLVSSDMSLSITTFLRIVKP
jgi:hypothetical protein